MKRPRTSLLSIGLALPIALASAGPTVAQSPAPAITIEKVPGMDQPDADTAPQAPAAKTPASASKKKGGEVLPWANKPLAPLATASTGDPAAADAAAAQCRGLFEAACRDLKTCAWVAGIGLADGTLVPAHCVARPAAPPKSTVKKKTAPVKKTAKAPAAEEVPAPAVKASVTRVEDEPLPKPEKKKAATELSKPEPPPAAKNEDPPPAVQAKATEPVEDAAPPAESKQVEAAENAEKKPEKTEEAKAPIVVKPPAPEADKPQMPSFSSVSPIMPGGGDAIVVTVPPSQ